MIALIGAILLPAVWAGPPTVGCVIAVVQVVRLRRRLLIDRLTGLANQDALLRVFARARRRGGDAVGVVLLDLDRFKEVNDWHGHAVGNAVLRHVATQLAAEMVGSELAVRLHGDEFAVLLTRLPDGAAGQQVARRVAERVRAAVAKPVLVGGVVCGVTVSVGIAVCPWAHADLLALLRVADQRMYAAKRGVCPVRIVESGTGAAPE